MSIDNFVWEQDKLVTKQIDEYINQVGENFENVTNAYFDEFKKRMKIIMRILEELVIKYYSNICFLVDIENTCIGSEANEGLVKKL